MTVSSDEEWTAHIKEGLRPILERFVLGERHAIEKLIESAIQRTNRDNAALIELLSSVASRPLTLDGFA